MDTEKTVYLYTDGACKGNPGAGGWGAVLRYGSREKELFGGEAKQPVKNEDLWKELDRLAAQHQVSWQWVKGHAGHPENERADALANQGAAQAGAA